jgi:ATP-dependent helicase/nuclease subunit B
MEQSAGANDVIREALRESRRAVVLHGPAASGKTNAAVAIYENCAAPGGPGECMLVVPNGITASALRGRLLDRSPCGALIRPRVMTLANLAGLIVGGADKPRRALSPFAASLLLREVAGELASRKLLGALEAVADTPGFVPALGRAIAELKRAAVEPDVLERAIRASGAAAGSRQKRDKSLAILDAYRLYQDRLARAGAYDTEGLFWEARDLLAARAAGGGSQPPGLEGIRVIVADGFTDFGPTQLAILRHLSRRLEKVVITLPLDLAEAESGVRERLWRPTLGALEAIRRTFGKDLAEIAVRPAAKSNGAPAAAMSPPSDDASEAGGVPRSLWDDLFQEESFSLRREPPKGLAVISAGSIEAETWAVARRVKRMLMRGTPPGSVAVLARSLEPYRGHVERVFGQCRIPIRPFPLDLADVPIIRYFLEAAALTPRFESAAVLRVIKSSYFCLGAMGAFTPRTVATAEMLIRHANVIEGRKAYAEAAQRLARRCAAPGQGGNSPPSEPPEETDDGTVDLGPLAASAADLECAAMMLESLFAACEAAACTEQSRGALKSPAGAAMAGLASVLRLEEAALACGEPELMARDLRAVEALRAAFAQAGERTAQADLRRALSAAPCPAARAEGVVDVLDVLDARATRYDHVFLMGLAEGQFPRPFAESSLLTERQRADWAPHGVGLDQRRDIACRETLLFYLAASRARRTLTLSFAESDAAGRPGAPGAMLLSFLTPLGGMEALRERGAISDEPRGRFVVGEADLAAPGEALAAAAAKLFGDSSAAAADAVNAADGALRWVRDNRPAAIRKLAWGLYAADRRWRRGACDGYDGRLSDPATLEIIARRYGPRAVFSASQLNSFGMCPWQFFAAYVLRLRPLEEPRRRLEPVALGKFYHDVLQDAFLRLAAEFGLPVRLGGIDPGKIEWALDVAIAEQSRRVELRRPPYPALWEALRRQARRNLRQYLLAQREAGEMAGESLRFELGFGPPAPGGEEEAQDPASQTRAVPIHTDKGDFLLRGRIDRVDRAATGSTRGLLVVDYKSGRRPDDGDIISGRSLQVPLYAAAAEQLLGEPCIGGAYHGVGKDPGQRWFAAVEPSRKGPRPNAEYPRRQKEAIDTAGRFVEEIRAGRFDLMPTAKCPAYCAFAGVCQHSPARHEVKAHAEEDGE